MEQCKVFLSKEYLKFSSAHMTVFPDGSKEALHGHNFQVSLEVHLKKATFSEMIDFSFFKKALKPLCDAWDEKVIIATKNPFFKGEQKGQEFEMVLCGKRYVFPVDEVVLLEVDNITSENLSKEMLTRLLKNIQQVNQIDKEGGSLASLISALELRIEETAGLGASYFWENEE